MTEVKVLLETKTVPFLRDIAKQFNISGRWDMTKAQLIDSIYEKAGLKEYAELTKKIIGYVQEKFPEIKETKVVKHTEEKFTKQINLKSEKVTKEHRPMDTTQAKVKRKPLKPVDCEVGDEVLVDLPGYYLRGKILAKNGTSIRVQGLTRDITLTVTPDRIVWKRHDGQQWPFWSIRRRD